LSHQLPEPHSASVKQVVPQAPVVWLQYGPLCVPAVQSVSLAHAPQVPEEAQYELAELGQASVAVEPLSPLQTTPVSVVASHTGVAAAQAALEVHCTHAPALAPPSTHAGSAAVGHGSVPATP
jgi:hypothetical protein